MAHRGVGGAWGGGGGGEGGGGDVLLTGADARFHINIIYVL